MSLCTDRVGFQKCEPEDNGPCEIAIAFVIERSKLMQEHMTMMKEHVMLMLAWSASDHLTPTSESRPWVR